MINLPLTIKTTSVRVINCGTNQEYLKDLPKSQKLNQEPEDHILDNDQMTEKSKLRKNPSILAKEDQWGKKERGQQKLIVPWESIEKIAIMSGEGLFLHEEEAIVNPRLKGENMVGLENKENLTSKFLIRGIVRNKVNLVTEINAAEKGIQAVLKQRSLT